jgi:hypothetical protein
VHNLPSILESGELRSDGPLEVDVLSELSHELRGSAEALGRSIDEFVTFALTPDSDRWVELREGATESTTWSAAARASSASDFVFLITTLADLGDDVILADGDAAGTFTRFAGGAESQRMLDRLHSADLLPAAEALVPGAVPFSAIQLIGVANDRVRDQVRALTATKTAVYPPWFQ